MKPKPKFCVGEEVAIVSSNPNYNSIDRTEVTRMVYKIMKDIETRELNLCWNYKTTSDTDNYWWKEENLRKLPPKTTFKSLMDKYRGGEPEDYTISTTFVPFPKELGLDDEPK